MERPQVTVYRCPSCGRIYETPVAIIAATCGQSTKGVPHKGAKMEEVESE